MEFSTRGKQKGKLIDIEYGVACLHDVILLSPRKQSFVNFKTKEVSTRCKHKGKLVALIDLHDKMLSLISSLKQTFANFKTRKFMELPTRSTQKSKIYSSH